MCQPPARFSASPPIETGEQYVGRAGSGSGQEQRGEDAEICSAAADFGLDEEVFGYELRFRDGLINGFRGDWDEASPATLDRPLITGLDVLCDGRRAFVNCTRYTLIKGLVTLLPPTSTAVEILENVPADPDVNGGPSKLERGGIPDRSR